MEALARPTLRQQPPNEQVTDANKKLPDLLMSNPCEAGNCQECPGNGADGFWCFKDPAKNAVLKLVAKNGVRCPCGCHFP